MFPVLTSRTYTLTKSRSRRNSSSIGSQVTTVAAAAAAAAAVNNFGIAARSLSTRETLMEQTSQARCPNLRRRATDYRARRTWLPVSLSRSARAGGGLLQLPRAPARRQAWQCMAVRHPHVTCQNPSNLQVHLSRARVLPGSGLLGTEILRDTNCFLYALFKQKFPYQLRIARTNRC